ncbi:hypothetical protein GMI70_00505 [Eggerthellaceae bacterium zg-893]|nr:hypothetical protein [Eggerthellaceae bacterium zg-893]
MYVPLIERCQIPQAAVLLQVTPLCQLPPESAVLLEALSEDCLSTEDALLSLYEGNAASSLAFIDCVQATELLHALMSMQEGCIAERRPDP